MARNVPARVLEALVGRERDRVAEVYELQVALSLPLRLEAASAGRREQHVLRLDVAMRDAARVAVRQRRQHGTHRALRLALAEAP